MLEAFKHKVTQATLMLFSPMRLKIKGLDAKQVNGTELFL